MTPFSWACCTASHSLASSSSRVETATAGVLVKGHPADKFHGEERLAIYTHPCFVDLSDTGMMEQGQDLCFVVEALDQFGRDEFGTDHLEGDGAARVVLFSLVRRCPCHPRRGAGGRDNGRCEAAGQARLSATATKNGQRFLGRANEWALQEAPPSGSIPKTMS
jgi:hypothetical protein